MRGGAGTKILEGGVIEPPPSHHKEVLKRIPSVSIHSRLVIVFRRPASGSNPIQYMIKGFGIYRVEMSLCLTKHYAMKTYWGSGGIAAHILHLGTRWR
jgi:hypothetical protein